MVKVRLTGDEKEVKLLAEILEELFPEYNFSTPRKGSNPKYNESKDVLSYSSFRVKDKKQRIPNIKKVHKILVNNKQK